MIDFTLTDEQTALREAAARYAHNRFADVALTWDAERRPLPDEERRRMADAGFLGIALPIEHGGAGGDLFDALLVIEELAKVCMPAAFQVFESNTGPARVLDLFGSAALQAKYLPSIIAGEATMALAISEPDAGSAATDLSTTARIDGDHVVLDGMKRWCSGAGHAESYLVYARFSEEPGSRGIGAAVVDRDADGVSFGPQEELMGFRSIPSADMFLDAVRVPKENVVIGAGGFRDLFTAFSIERLGNATMSLAIGQACLERTARYVQEREQFGRPIVEFQTVQAGIADMLLAVEATRLLVWRGAASAGRGAPSSLEASLAKCHANEMAKRVSDMAIQLHGGYGYSREYGIERFHRDAHGWALGGGTPTIQRLRIASEYLERSFSQRGD